MKNKYTPFLRFASFVAASAAFASSAHAADYYWTGSSSSTFQTGANWFGNSYAEWGDYHFDSNTTNGSVTLPGFVGISGLYLDSGLTTDITIGSGKIGMTANNITQPAPYHADIVIDATSKNLTINSDETSYGATTWTVGANRTLTLNGVFSNWYGQGVGSLVKTGAGTAVLANSNTYTGKTTVNEGVLKLTGNWAFGDVNVGQVNAGITVESGATLRADNSLANQLNGLTLNGGTVDAINSSGNSDWGNFFLIGNVVASENSSLSADIALRATNVDFNVANGGTLNVGGKLHNGVFFGAELGGNNGSAGGTASTVSKSGTGTMVLSGSNTYTGNTVVSEGSLEVIASASLQFRPTTNGATNSVSGSGTGSLSFVGTVVLDLSAADATGGNTWTLFNIGSFNTAPDLSSIAAVNSSIGNFTELPDGTWELSVTGAKWVFTESDGKLAYVSTATPYETWGSNYGLTAGSEGLDLDGDGMTNFEEFAFGLLPNNGASSTPITNLLNKTNGQFTYQRLNGSGLTYTIWTSPDLVTWTEDGTATANQNVTTGTPNDSVVVTLTNSLLTNSRLFVRVQAQ